MIRPTLAAWPMERVSSSSRRPVPRWPVAADQQPPVAGPVGVDAGPGPGVPNEINFSPQGPSRPRNCSSDGMWSGGVPGARTLNRRIKSALDQCRLLSQRATLCRSVRLRLPADVGPWRCVPRCIPYTRATTEHSFALDRGIRRRPCALADTGAVIAVGDCCPRLVIDGIPGFFAGVGWCDVAALPRVLGVSAGRA